MMAQIEILENLAKDYKDGRLSALVGAGFSKNVSNKLNEEQVKEIYLSKLSFNKLSKLYGVSKTNISLIKNKKQWKWFTDNLD